ncbi:hypothetical protein GE061_008273 [Apolygus lucorum]|uniref:Uncharacterized protein n=1 Tax=Apolygus lucorum TaxID=248454 RepID=A0A6A4IUD7_APOLU|nr:hypothetical protein GE061_008273 [Apolygus lucorum]
MSGGKTACKPGSNPKDIKRHERRKQRMKRQLAAGARLESSLDIHSMVEKATSEALGELKEGDIITEEMVAQLEVRLRSALANVVDEVAQVAKKIVVPSCAGVTR